MTIGDSTQLQRPRSALPLLAAAALLLALAACGTGTVEPAAKPSTPAAQTVALDVAPGTAQIQAGGTVAFAATVTGSADTTVVWDVVEASGGSVTAAGLYTAPGTAGTFHVRARSHAAPTVLTTAAVTVTAPPPPPPPPPPPITVSISPSTGAAVAACRTLAFTATVTGTTNGAVTWAVQEAGGGSVDANGVYTAPQAAGTYHVVATSAASAGSTATVPVTVSDSILGVAVSPQNVSLAPGETAQFTATVTTTCGTFVSTQTVTAPL